MLKMRQERLKREWTQAEAAKRAGISTGTYQRLETGRGWDASYWTIVKLMNAFDCDYHLLFDQEDTDDANGTERN